MYHHMRFIYFLLLLFTGEAASAQFSIPAYNVVKDSTTHITVFHSGNDAKIKHSSDRYTDTLRLISPDIRIQNGIVDHKSLTGEIYVREYYADSTLIGYIDYDGHDMLRELFFNAAGKVFLETHYDKGQLIYTKQAIQNIRVEH
jgi:hypothetical protein